MMQHLQHAPKHTVHEMRERLHISNEPSARVCILHVPMFNVELWSQGHDLNSDLGGGR